MLEEYAGSKAEIGITLKDATLVKGYVKSFDGYVILMEGEPGELVYRHSILKLSSSAVAVQPQPAPAFRRPEAPSAMPRATMERKFQRPTEPRRKLPPRPRPERQPESKREEKPGQLGTLGEEMMKWLKSQKGNE